MSKDLINELENYWSNFGKKDLNFISSSNDEPIIFTYGTTPFETFKKVIQQLKTPKRFIVLGSSIGWQSFYWNELYPEIPTIGYEIHDLRFEFSCYLADKYEKDNIDFVYDSLLNAEIQDGDLIWENNLCIPEEISDEFNMRVLSRFNDIQIVSYLPILSENQQKNGDIIIISDRNELKGFKSKRIQLPVSWSENQNFYII